MTAGALSAVLSEYLHLLREFEGLFQPVGDELAEKLAKAFRLVPGLGAAPVRTDEFKRENGVVGVKEHRMRTHIAVRFAQDKAVDVEGAESARPDAVRAAFNSPFWPFVLCSTSVGQEGLDFHGYCHAIVHWNLPSNPVDLEQREGRIHRYKGHAIRKNVALRFASSANRSGDPWAQMFERAADEAGANSRGLMPYWVYPVEGGAFIERHVPALPFTRDRFQLEDLRRSLAVYRMVFGQPRQDDLLAYLLENVEPSALEEHRDLLRIDLGPPRLESTREPSSETREPH